MNFGDVVYRSTLVLLFSSMLLVFSPFEVLANPGDEYWVEGFGRVGANRPVKSLLSTPSGLVAGGDFQYVGESTCPHIARWNGMVWEDLGEGLNGPVHCTILFQGELIAGGEFQSTGDQPLNNIARWDGQSWLPLGAGAGSAVVAMTVYDGKLVASGDFSSSAGPDATYIAAWNGSQWLPIGEGLEDRFDRPPYTLTVFENGLIAAGHNVMARFEGESWADSYGLPGDFGSHSMFGYTPVSVYGLVVFQGELHALGDFVKDAGVGQPYAYMSIARWDGSEWQGLGRGLLGSPSPIEGPTFATEATVHDDMLVVVGYFLFADEAGDVNGTAGWDGSTWHAFAEGVLPWAEGPVTVASWEDDLFIGGGFTRTIESNTPSSVEVYHISKWGADAWEPVGEVSNGLDGPVNDLVEYQGGFIAGGNFDQAGSTSAKNIALWLDGQWYALGEGMTGEWNEEVTALTLFENDLIAGGSFHTAGGSPASNIARWNGESWSALGGGIPNPVNCLAVYQGELWANGFRFDGQDWIDEIQANDQVLALQVWNSNLYAGGKFQEARGLPVDKIVRWDGYDCHPVGEIGRLSGRYQGVLDLDIYQGDLAVAGSFYNVGGSIGNNYLARWDGTDWHPLGDPLSGFNSFYGVYSIACIGDQLFMGGRIDKAGDLPVNMIARWDGLQWHNMGSGIEEGYIPGSYPSRTNVLAMLPWGSNLLIGGNFTTAGGKAAHGLTNWRGPSVVAGVEDQVEMPEPLDRLSVYPNPFNPSTTISYLGRSDAQVKVSVYDVRGVLVDVIHDGAGRAGWQQFHWDAEAQASGVYFVRVISNGGQEIEKAVLLK